MTPKDLQRLLIAAMSQGIATMQELNRVFIANGLDTNAKKLAYFGI